MKKFCENPECKLNILVDDELDEFYMYDEKSTNFSQIKYTRKYFDIGPNKIYLCNVCYNAAKIVLNNFIKYL
jgi:hypothetical protein